ncbi:hypothetical protein GRI97_16210 [Altererythrobacter xixiisoli]|uniref:Uncharacterized protein n=1 Tax=Croceibacterium xixiisoli TaxID=1476466 RepID=A0A6I4TX08_9SPHN|nr:hypothetical protein [Croceibacterium xixiisoli]MXP00535.1 hypothetical protein [Croceibacterium xixiisoli]
MAGKKRARLKAALGNPRAGKGGVPGLSPNPATNLLIATVAMRGASMLMRRGMERGLLRSRYEPSIAEDIIKGRTLGQTVIATTVARVATGSIPGMVAVTGALFLKAAYERGRARRELRKGDAKLAKMARLGHKKDTAETD